MEFRYNSPKRRALAVFENRGWLASTVEAPSVPLQTELESLRIRGLPCPLVYRTANPQPSRSFLLCDFEWRQTARLPRCGAPPCGVRRKRIRSNFGKFVATGGANWQYLRIG